MEVFYKRSEGISSRRLGGELMLYDGERDKIHTLNETGAFIWDMLNGTNSTAHIEKMLKKEFSNIPENRISKDIAGIIEKLKTEGLIRLCGIPDP